MNITQKAIELAGGNQAVAADIGVQSTTVWRWGKDQDFPPRHVRRLCELGGDHYKPEQIRPDFFSEAASK